MKKAGFTLIELLMVIAIIAIITMLAIQKLGGLKEDSKEKINIANVVRISNALETHVAAGTGKLSFDKLDGLTMYDAATGTAGGTSDLAKTDALMVYTNQIGNTGLSSDIADPAKSNGYAGSSAGVLGTYYLQDSEVKVLEDDLGLKYVMRGTDGAMNRQGDDGAWAQGDISDPNACASVATLLTNGIAVAVVNPGATAGRSPVGPSIYKACGSDVAYSYQGKVLVNGVACDDNEAAFNALRAGDGILLAFGLGDNCALVGNNLSGLASAPVSPIADEDEYGRYIVLVRISYTAAAGRNGTTYTAKRAEFAGILDPRGRTESMLRQ